MKTLETITMALVITAVITTAFVKTLTSMSDTQTNIYLAIK